MELKYDGRKFIGVVKFFDAVKGFGFIASNRCGMPDQKEYDQVFYVDTSSFPDGKHIKDDGIVVFQIEQQSSNRLRAVNVRFISKSDEDKELLLQYYDDYETFNLKDRTVNVFRHFKFHSVLRLLEITAQRVENEELRNVERTTKLITSLIGHFYTRKINGATQYIFDYDTDNRKQWEKFFKGLTSEELVAIIKEYPTAITFTKDQSIITDWIADFQDKELDLPALFTLKYTMEYLPKRKGNVVQKLINKNVERLVSELIYKCGNSTSVFEFDVTGETKQFHELTGEDYDFLQTKCKDSKKQRELRLKLEGFRSRSDYTFEAYKVAELYRELSEEGKVTVIGEIKESVTEKIASMGQDVQIWNIFELLGVFSFLGQEFSRPYYEQYQEMANEDLMKTIEGDRVNDVIQVASFIDLFQKYFEYNCSDEFIATAKKQLLSSTSLEALNKMCYKYSWSDECNISFLTREEIFERVREVISNWSIQEVNDFINSERVVFEKENSLDISVINRAFDLIGNMPLSRSFGLPPFNSLFDAFQDLSSLKYSSEMPADPDVIAKNCSFLKVLGQLKGDDQTEKRCSNYIQSCNYQEKLALFRNGVISGSPQDVAEEIISGLTVNDFIDYNSKLPTWIAQYNGYVRPRLKDDEQEKVLKSSNGLFEVVENRVLSIELTPDNYYLVIFLLELVRLKLPEYPEYYERRDWEKELKNFINRLIFKSSDNPKLKTILWSVFSS